MNDTIKGALIGAIIPTIGSFAIFLLGNFHTQSYLERDTVSILSKYFDDVDKEMAYEEAFQAAYNQYKKTKKENKKLTSQLKKQQEQIDQQNSIEEINKTMQEATDYWNNSDYEQCLTLLKTTKSKSKDIELLYKQYSKQYCNDLLSEVDELISERNNVEAIKKLTDGSMLVSDNELLNNKIDEIKNKPSVTLSSVLAN